MCTDRAAKDVVWPMGYALERDGLPGAGVELAMVDKAIWRSDGRSGTKIPAAVTLEAHMGARLRGLENRSSQYADRLDVLVWRERVERASLARDLVQVRDLW